MTRDKSHLSYDEKLLRVTQAAASGAQAQSARRVDSISRSVHFARGGAARSDGNLEEPAYQEWLAEQEAEIQEWERALRAVLEMLRTQQEPPP